ncbi:MAG: hypothetical protein EWV84_19465 [Microcystis sp. M_QC_C_20170808_M3Col]|nr:MAG: hypothetical protein EWV84_19465 [Microcystis sp. M_QC_C_20170808_M3Col]
MGVGGWGLGVGGWVLGVGGWGLGVGGWGVGFYHLNFPPDHSHAGYFLIDKKSKSLTQQGFYIYSANPN